MNKLHSTKMMRMVFIYYNVIVLITSVMKTYNTRKIQLIARNKLWSHYAVWRNNTSIIMSVIMLSIVWQANKAVININISN